MDHPDFIVCSFMENSICLKRMKKELKCISFLFLLLLTWVKAGFSLTFVFQESLGLPSVVFESPWANFKSPMCKCIVSGVKTEGNRRAVKNFRVLLAI